MDMFGRRAPAGDDVGERGLGHAGVCGEILEDDAPFDEPGAAPILTGGGNCVNRFTEIHSETSFWPPAGRARSRLAKTCPLVCVLGMNSE